MVMILRYWSGNKYRFTLRNLDRTTFCYRWFNTMKAAKEYAKEKGVEILDRPDLIEKRSTPSQQRILDI